MRDVKRGIASGCEEANDARLAEIEKVVKDITAVKNGLEKVVNAIKTIATNHQIKNQQKNAEDVSKQALVSALVCEYQLLLSVKNYCTDTTLVSVFSVK